MQKAGHLRISILVLMFCLGLSNGLLAQTTRDTMGFTWKLLEVADPSTQAKIQFTPLVSIPALFTSWDFGDTGTSTDSIATHTYTTLNTYDVKYKFKFNSRDSIITRKTDANSAAFFARLDSNTNVTYVRILTSAFQFRSNDISTHGAMRFEWSVNGTVLTDPNYRLPNIRYTFENSGLNTVTLKAWNIADPTKSCTFSRVINIVPSFTTKEKFANIPNVFTPNGDGVFDNFQVQTSGVSRLAFKVYTRTGALVFQNEAYYQLGWEE